MLARWVWSRLQELVEQSLAFDLGDSKVAEDFAFFLRLLISMRRQHHRVAVAAPVPVEDDARSEASAASAVSAMELKLRAWRVMISGWQN